MNGASWTKIFVSQKIWISSKKVYEVYTAFSGNSVFRCHNTKGVKLLTRLRLGLSHLWKHKFKHSFLDSLNTICSCGEDIETSTHFLLHCSNYSNERSTFLNIIKNIDRNIFEKNDLKIKETLRYGATSPGDTNNTLIMNTTMEFLIISVELLGRMWLCLLLTF